MTKGNKVTKQLLILNKLKTKLLLLLAACFVLVSGAVSAQSLDAGSITSGYVRGENNISDKNYNIQVPAAESVVKPRPSRLGDTDARQEDQNVADMQKSKLGNATRDRSNVGIGDKIGDFVRHEKNTRLHPIDHLKVLAGVYKYPCNVKRMESIYKSGCYSCIIVKGLISVFLNACSKLYDLSREAGVKILLIGLLIWLPFYILQQLSSLKNLEPAAMVNDLLTMAFKVLVAYLVINAGIQFFIDFIVNPILEAGADFGMMMLNAATNESGIDMSAVLNEDSTITEDTVMPKALLNNIMSYIAVINGTVSTHMEIGHMVTCHSLNAGRWDWTILGHGITVVNLWLWIAGAFIWFMGFMMTFSVTFYLVDISFKIGFTIVALPIAVGLWPFNITKDRLGACVGMVLNAAGIFLFLAMTVAIGLMLVSGSLDLATTGADTAELEAAAQERGLNWDSLSGADRLMMAIEDENTELVSKKFALFSTSWILIAIACLYALKLIGSTVSDFVNQFFPDNVMGGASPMHQKMVQYTDIAKSKVKKLGKKVAKRAKKAAKAIRSKFKENDPKEIADKYKDQKKDSGKSAGEVISKTNEQLDNLKEGKAGEKAAKDDKTQSTLSKANLNNDKDKKVRDAGAKGTQAAGKGAKAAGKAMQASGEGMEQLGGVAENAAQGAGQVADAVNKSGQGLVQQGAAASSTIIGAIVGIPMMIAGGAMVAGGVAGKTGAKGMEIAAKAMKKGGKMLKKAGEKVEKAGKKLEEAGKKLEKKGKSTINKARNKSDENMKQQQKKQDNNNNNNNDGNNNNNQNRNSGTNGNNNDDLINAMGSAARGKK